MFKDESLSRLMDSPLAEGAIPHAELFARILELALPFCKS